jgi:hypothetical protein
MKNNKSIKNDYTYMLNTWKKCPFNNEIYLVYYCMKHDQGYVVMMNDDDVQIPDNMSNYTCGNNCLNKGYHSYQGKIIFDDKIDDTELYCCQKFYDRCNGCWKISNFGNEIYDINGNHLEIPIIKKYFDSKKN